MRTGIAVLALISLSVLPDWVEAKGRGRVRSSVVLRAPAPTTATTAFAPGHPAQTSPAAEAQALKPNLDFFNDKGAKTTAPERVIDHEAAKASFETAHAKQLAAKARSEQEDAQENRLKQAVPASSSRQTEARRHLQAPACNQGLVLQSGACVEASLPANAQLNYQGTGWECISGYQRNGQVCSKIELPANAVLNFRGDDWKCVRGFQRSGNQCI